MKLKEIRPDEANELSQLSREIYAQYYLHLWHDSGAWYTQTRYGAETLALEVANAGVGYYWIFLEEKKCGILKLVFSAAPKELEELPSEKGLEVERIYISKDAIGKGLGKKVMRWAENVALELGRDFVFLYAMDTSEACVFYEKMGYAKAADKRLDFDKMKPEYRGMHLMIKSLL